MQDRRAGPQCQPQQGFDRGDVRDDQYGAGAVVGDDAVAGALNAMLDLIEALAARCAEAGVTQPAAVQLGMPL